MFLPCSYPSICRRGLQDPRARQTLLGIEPIHQSGGAHHDRAPRPHYDALEDGAAEVSAEPSTPNRPQQTPRKKMACKAEGLKTHTWAGPGSAASAIRLLSWTAHQSPKEATSTPVGQSRNPPSTKGSAASSTM